MTKSKSKHNSSPKKITTKTKQLKAKLKKRRDAKSAALLYHQQHPEASLRFISKETGVPKSTLFDLFKGKTQINSHAGRRTYFDEKEEAELEQWIFDRVNHGFGISESDVMVKANEMYYKKTGSEKHLTDGWYSDFRARHPKVVKRATSHLSILRKKSEDPELVSSFFNTLRSVITENKLLPSQVFNCDETGLIRNHANNYTLAAKRGSKDVEIIVPQERRPLCLLVLVLTVQFCLL